MDKNLAIMCWCYVKNSTFGRVIDRNIGSLRRPLPIHCAKVEVLEQREGTGTQIV